MLIVILFQQLAIKKKQNKKKKVNILNIMLTGWQVMLEIHWIKLQHGKSTAK